MAEAKAREPVARPFCLYVSCIFEYLCVLQVGNKISLK